MSTRTQTAGTGTGRFGPYGGRYVPETLMAPLEELERAYEAAKTDAAFQAEFADLLKNFAGRPTPLQFTARLTEHLRSEEHTSELQSRLHLVCRLLLEKKQLSKQHGDG